MLLCFRSAVLYRRIAVWIRTQNGVNMDHWSQQRQHSQLFQFYYTCVCAELNVCCSVKKGMGSSEYVYVGGEGYALKGNV